MYDVGQNHMYIGHFPHNHKAKRSTKQSLKILDLLIIHFYEGFTSYATVFHLQHKQVICMHVHVPIKSIICNVLYDILFHMMLFVE